MKLYEINQEIEKTLSECIDTETGEIKDLNRLEELTLAKEEKVRNIALFILDLRAEEKAYDEQLKKFLALKKSVKNKITSLENYLQMHTEGQPFKFTEVKISYKPSEETVIEDIEALEKYCKRSHKELGTWEFKPNKTAIKNAIASGLKVKGAAVIKKQNIQVK